MMYYYTITKYVIPDFETAIAVLATLKISD